MQQDLADMPDIVYIGRNPSPLRMRLAKDSAFSWAWLSKGDDDLPEGLTVDLRFNNGQVWTGVATGKIVQWSEDATRVMSIVNDLSARQVVMWWCEPGVDEYVVARGDVVLK